MTGLLSSQASFVRALVRRVNGVVLKEDKPYIIEANLAKLANRERFKSVAELLRRLAEPGVPASLEYAVTESLTNQETSFFRDLYPFQAIEKRLLREMIERRAAEHRLMIWSAACSSGQELYSVALMIEEAFPELLGWEVDLVGTDFSKAMVHRAIEAKYSQLEVNRGLPATYLVKYFQREGLQWRLSAGIRKRTEFRQVNLVTDPMPLAAVDIILVRNILIYFDETTQKKVLGRMMARLRRGGYIILGNGETLKEEYPGLHKVQIDKLACYYLRMS